MKALALVATLVFAAPVFAQEATLSGTISDQTNSVLPGVTITAVHDASGNTFVATSDDRGFYRLPLRTGLYRLAVKWGWLTGKDANATRRRLKQLKWAITVFFLALGFATLAAYVKIGIEHRDHAGEPYVPTHLLPAKKPAS